MSMLKHVLGFFALNKNESMNGNFNTLVQYTINYLLIPSVLCFLPWSIQAEDKTIDGIKIRYGQSFTNDRFVLGDSSIASSSSEINVEENHAGFRGRDRFPITITFPETASSWTFRQAYFDFISNEKITDIPPYPDTDIPDQLTRLEESGGTSFNMRQKDETRIYLKENFLPKFLSSSQLSNLPTNWAISYDIERSIVSLGYMWGVYLPIGEMHRLFKIGLGLGISRTENKIKINLCDKYNVIAKYISSKREFETPHEGKCINPNRLAYLSYVEGGWSFIGGLTIWERVSKDSVWTFGLIEASLIQSFWRGESLESIDGIDGKWAKFFPQRGATDILSYTYRF